MIEVTRSIAGPGDEIAADNDNAAKKSARINRKARASGTGHRAAMAAGLPFYMPGTPGADFNDLGTEATRLIFDAPPISALPVIEVERITRFPLTDGRANTLRAALADAITPEDAAARAWAVALRLAPRIPSRLSLADLRARLDHDLPPGLAHPATLDLIVEEIEEKVARRRKAARDLISLPADAAARHRHENCRELPRLTPEDYQGVIVVKAPMGAGKTQKIGRPFARWAACQGQVLAICHRVTLVAELAQRLNLPDYRRVEPVDPNWAGSMAVCLPSITSEALRHRAEQADFLFIDEIAQVLRFFRSEAKCRTRLVTNEGVLAALRALVRRARCVIVADAHIDRRTLEFLESCRPGERFRIIEVEEPASAGITAEFSTGTGAAAWVLRRTLAEVQAGGAVWLAAESAKRALQAERFLRDQGVNAIAVTAGNRGGADQAALLADIEGQSRVYQVVIVSPVIGSGVSIEHRTGGRHFTMGAVIASGAALSPADVFQMMRRVRYLARFVIGLTGANASRQASAEAALWAREEASRIEGAPQGRSGFDAFIAGIRADEATARADFASGLLWQLDTAGWTVIAADDTLDPGNATGAALKGAQAALTAERRAALRAAPQLTAEEADRLARRDGLTAEEDATLEAHRIRTAFALTDDLTDEALDVWAEGHGLRMLDRAAALHGIGQAHDDSAEGLTRRRFWRAAATLYAELFDGIDIASPDWLTDQVAETILDRILCRRHVLAELGIVAPKFAEWRTDQEGNPMQMARPAYPMREVIDMLRRVGLKTEGRRVRATSTALPGAAEGKPSTLADQWNNVFSASALNRPGFTGG